MALFVAMGVGCIAGAVYTMYNHEQHISDYAITSLDSIKDERNHILELDDIRIDALIFQNIKNNPVSYTEFRNPLTLRFGPVQKTRMIMINGVSSTQTYMDYDYTYANDPKFVTQTRDEKSFKNDYFFVSYNHNNKITFTNPIEITSINPKQINDINEAQIYIQNNIPDFRRSISFNHCFYHHKFSGKVYLHGKMINGKFICNHLSCNKSLIIQKQSCCCLCLSETYK